MPHDDHTAHDVAFSIKIHNTASDFRPDLHMSNVFDKNGRACFGIISYNNILDILRVTAAADHKLKSGNLQQPSAHVVIALAHRIDHLSKRNVISKQPV